MPFGTRVAPLIACLAATLAGCSHLAEKRALSRFSEALQAGQLEALKAGTSPDFARRALRRDEALDNLKMLRLPTGEIEIVEVEKVSASERLITAEVGPGKRRAFYRLVREPESRSWVIDDVLVRQNLDGVRRDRSLAGQMDLLLAVHEFLEAWNGGRGEALEATTPEFQRVLADLPPVHFARLTQRVVGDEPEKLRLTSPGVTNEQTGIVRVPRKTGTVVLTIQQLDGEWKVADVAVESRSDGEHIPSVLKMAVALNASVDFLEAYRAGDKRRLADLCTETFYRRGLLPGELEAIPLPAGDVPTDETRIDMQPTSAEFLIPTGREVVKLSLRRMGDANDSESLPEFRVDEVTIYEPGPDNGPPREMRLSVLFTGRAMLRLFGEALSHGDLPMLRETSTPDFNRRVWQHLDEAALRELGPMIAFGGPFQIVNTKFQGAVTEVTVDQAGRRLTYVLRDRAGDVRIDDVLVSSPVLPGSLKETVELLLPVRSFASGLSLSRLDVLQRNSSRDLNRHVWTQADQVPPVSYAAVPCLRAPLTSVEQTAEDELLVVLGDEQFGSRVLLVREGTHYVVDDVLLIAGPESGQRARLKRRLREELAHGMPRRHRTLPPNSATVYNGAESGTGLRPVAGASTDLPYSGPGAHLGTSIQPAGYEAPQPRPGASFAAAPMPSQSAFDAPANLQLPLPDAVEFHPAAPSHGAQSRPVSVPVDSGERVHLVPRGHAGAVAPRSATWD